MNQKVIINTVYAKVWNGNSSVNDCQSQFMWISASPSKWYQSFYSHWSASESIQKRDTRKGLPLPLCVLVRRMKRIFQGEKRKKKISSSGLVVAGLACTPALLLFFWEVASWLHGSFWKYKLWNKWDPHDFEYNEFVTLSRSLLKFSVFPSSPSRMSISSR